MSNNFLKSNSSILGTSNLSSQHESKLSTNSINADFVDLS